MRRAIVFILFASVIIVGLSYYFASRQSFILSRRRFDKPPPDGDKNPSTITYRNTNPEVKYVGDQACAGCHVSQAESYRHHPMGRSFAPVADIVAEERYEKDTHNPFQALGFQFLIKLRDTQVFHQQVLRDAKGQVILEREDQVHYVLGSGSQGRAYLLERDGFLFESPISWFSQKQIWDLSPGFEEASLAGRPISANCLFCHCNRANSVKDSLNHYQKPIFDGYAIGCERCHGPGELHVQKQERGDINPGVDDTIVNPARLPPDLREAVCQQCHLIGKSRVLPRGRHAYDYRPGLPLHEYWAVFVAPPRLAGNYQAVGQVEQMYISRCFRGSNRALGCVSCHDPHSLPPPKEKIAYYRRQCLQCHQEKGCTESVAIRAATTPGDNCTQCHMPRFATADIAHTAGTDHRIRRRPDKSLPGFKTFGPREMPIVSFHQHLLDSKDPNAKRDLAMALADLSARDRDVSRATAQLALPLLNETLRADPDDVSALEARGRALGALDRVEEARTNFEQALLIAPNREVLLHAAALIAIQIDDLDLAVDHWKRAQALNPWEPSCHFYLGQLYAKHQQLAQAIQEFQAAIRLHPADSNSHRHLVLCWVHSGEPGKARRELELAIALTPTDADKLRTWYDDLTKKAKTEDRK